MNLEQMKYIVEVAKTKSITAASKNLFVTPSAISQSIIQLEEELGLKLFNRSRQGVTITSEGYSIIDGALEITERLEQIKEDALFHQKKSNEHIKLAAVAGVMPLLIRHISIFKKDHPDVQIEIIEMSTNEILDAMKQDQVEFGVISMRSSDSNKTNFLKGMKYRVITESVIGAIVPISFEIASKKSITADELKQQNLIIYKDNFLDWFVEDFSATYGSLNVMITTNNTEVLYRFLEGRLGISIGLKYLTCDYLQTSDKVKYIFIEDYKDECIEIGWIHSEKKMLSAIAMKFMAQCEALQFSYI